MQKLKILRKNSILKADGKTLVFEDGICKVKKITKNIQSLIDAGYIKLEDKEDVESINS